MAASIQGLPFDPLPLMSFNEPFDSTKVQMLDAVISCMYTGNAVQRKVADEVLRQMKAHPDSWQVVDSILGTSQDANTRFFALGLLAGTINARRLVLPAEHRMGIKNYIVQLVIKISADDKLATEQRHFLIKLNETLIAIVKQEWPHSWENFIPDICGSSRTNQSLCENNLRVLYLLSEEVFNFGKNHMVTKKVQLLKDILNQQFSNIYELCDFVFKTHITQPGVVRPSLITTALSALAGFLDWIPLGYIFETDLIQMLLVHFWDPLEFRMGCVKCLNEVACLHEGVQQYQPRIVQCFQGVVEKIQQLPQNPADFRGATAVYWEEFHNQMALLLTGFLKHNVAAMEENPQYTIPALRYLVFMTSGQNEETFKICVEFWLTFSSRLFLEVQQRRRGGGSLPTGPLMLDGFGQQQSASVESKLQQYKPVLTEVRRVLISKMAKPPEVTIKENEEGHIVRCEEEDTDEIALYKMLRETLIFLTHLDPENMEAIMCERLSQECCHTPASGWGSEQDKWSPTLLNRLCWAIGSISGAMQEKEEKRFLVSVIKDLLSLCEMKRGKENKAVVASNIMYVVGQYPRFLRAHWKFLKTVIHKLFEFMHETFPGVQEMAVDTFLKICQKCKKKFVVIHSGEQVPFVEELMQHVHQDISELEHLHMCTYFEAVGCMISAADSLAKKDALVRQLMASFNERWARVVGCLNQHGPQEVLKDPQALREISLILRVNERMVSSVGAACHAQLAAIYYDMLKVYKVCSEFISACIAQQGVQAMSNSHVKLFRNVKRAALRLVQTFVEATTTEQASAEAGTSSTELVGRFIPPLLEPVLEDYKSTLPQARDAEVLDLLATLASKLSSTIGAEVERIFGMVFESTLDMIKGDFQSYPDHRTKFYDLLKAINLYCFEALFNLPPYQLKLYVDSLIWAMKHEQPQVAELGLQILEKFLDKLLTGPNKVVLPFFKQYYFTLMQDLLSVLTDTLHKAGFKSQQSILLKLLHAVNSGRLMEVEITKQRTMEFLFELISKSFQALHRCQVEIFCLNCFNMCGDPTNPTVAANFQQHIRDFLIQLREYGSHEEAFYELDRQDAHKQQEQQALQLKMMVPGLVGGGATLAGMDDL